jgi:hypothetical protein
MELMEAVANAAIRHGGDGRGKDGLVGYILLLQRTEPKTFNMLTGVAQRWQNFKASFDQEFSKYAPSCPDTPRMLPAA